MDRIEPKTQTDDGTDRAVSLVVLVIQFFVVSILPGYLIYFLTGNSYLSWGTGLIMLLAFAGQGVSALEVSEEGIRVSRLYGSPKFLPWSEVSQVEEVGRTEVVVFGWLWPPFPAREMTPSSSSVGHFRIRYRNGYFFYPPANPVHFMEVINKYIEKAPSDAGDL